MALCAKDGSCSISLTNDKFIGPVIDVSCAGFVDTLFLCCGKWVALSECEESCLKFWRCDNVGQVNMVGSEVYQDEVVD